MKNLIIRLETKCSAGLDQCGVYRYAESSDFQPLLLSFCADDGPVQTVDLTTGRPPPEILDALTQKEIIKWSLDGTAARTCLSRWMKDHGIPLNAQTDPNSALMLVCARLRHVAGTQWGNKKYMNTKHLEAALEDTSIAG